MRRYVRLPGSVDEPFLMIDYSVSGTCTSAANGAASCERWAHQNRLGSVVAVTSNAGAVLERHRYGPYGEIGGSASGFPFRFTGQKLDPETGLYYYKARFYDPEVGRFLQTDPIGYKDQMNLYAYVGNDPVNATDPSGRVIVVLNTRPFAPSWMGMEHQGVLIGNDEDGWIYLSEDGGDQQTVKRFDSFEEALATPDIGGRYKYAYRAETNSEQDRKAREAGIRRLFSTRYNFVTNNCGDLVKACTDAAGVDYPDTVNPADARRQAEDLPEWEDISDQIPEITEEEIEEYCEENYCYR